MFRIHSIISSFSLHGHQLSSTIQRDCPDHRRLVALGLQEPSELKEADALVALQTPLGSKALRDEWMTRWVDGSLIGLAGCLSKANPTSKNICTYICIYIYCIYSNLFKKSFKTPWIDLETKNDLKMQFLVFRVFSGCKLMEVYSRQQNSSTWLKVKVLRL